MKSEELIRGMFTSERISYPCPYFSDGRQTTIEYFHPTIDQVLEYDEMLARGFRRSGEVFYKNVCENCAECISIRSDVQCSRPDKAQRRLLRKNSWIKVRDILSDDEERVTEEKLTLYKNYLRKKHERVAGEFECWEDLMCLHYGYPRIRELHFLDGNKLIGVSVMDETLSGFSSNYFYYDTDYLEHRMGIFSMLCELELAKRLSKKWHYMGFYIEKCPKMSYKKVFKPFELLTEGNWKEPAGLKI
jgi:leucyl-tRNA---protein transferase